MTYPLRNAKPIRDDAWLKAQRLMACTTTRRRASEGESVVAAHLRLSRSGGMGQKPSDMHTFPLCASEHDRQHRVGEYTFWLEAMTKDRSLLAEILTLASEGLYARWKEGR